MEKAAIPQPFYIGRKQYFDLKATLKSSNLVTFDGDKVNFVFVELSYCLCL